MLDFELASALLTILRTQPVLAALHPFTGHDEETHKLPALTVSAQSESLAGSSSVFRATVVVLLESDARDDSPEQHAQRVAALRAMIANKPALIASINAAGQVHLHGYAVGNSEPGVDATRFRTPVVLKAGYSVP